MNLIEQAAKRLEELRRAGIRVPDDNGGRLGTPKLRNVTTPVTASARKYTSLAGSNTDDVESRPHKAGIQERFDLNLARLAAQGFVTPDMPRSRIGDEFRVIKRPLLVNTSDKKPHPVKNGNLIMVTSAIPGEGKTFTAVNLAMSIATEVNKTVLLVDADVARPSFSKVLGLPDEKCGLLDVLDDSSIQLPDVLVRTNIENLSILPSGTPHAQATELLASEAMSRLLSELAARYSDRILIFDSPPLLVTTESRVLATQMGQVVFVVHAESTLQSDVKRALATIEACPIKLMVLNQAKTVAQGAYGYGYGYGA